MSTIIVTNCTNRKRTSIGEAIKSPVRNDDESLFDFATRWLTLSENYPNRVTPDKLYCGRGYSEILIAANHLSADVYTISAGFGLLSSIDLLPPYNLSMGDLASLQSSPEKWWKTINNARKRENPLTEILMDDSISMALIGISKAYIKLIQTELSELPKKAWDKVRLITGYEPPAELISNTIIYDSRLDGPDSPIRGTRSDFNSRAIRHFAEYVIGKSLNNSIESQRELVTNLLESMSAPTIPTRKKVTDDEIKKLIIKYWDSAEGKSSKSLRLLRDNAGVACEQGRFAELFRQIKAK